MSGTFVSCKVVKCHKVGTTRFWEGRFINTNSNMTNMKIKQKVFVEFFWSEYCQTVKKCDQQSQINFQFDRSIQALVVHNFLSRPI